MFSFVQRRNGTEFDVRDENQASYVDETRGVQESAGLANKMSSMRSQQLSRTVLSTDALSIPLGYHTILEKRAQMAVTGILPLTFNIILKTVHSLPVSPNPVHSLPCTKPESSGNDQIESYSFGAQEWSEIPPAVQPNDMMGKHRDQE